MSDKRLSNWSNSSDTHATGGYSKPSVATRKRGFNLVLGGLVLSTICEWRLAIWAGSMSSRLCASMRKNELALLPAPAPKADVTVGFIYIGPKNDYGYSQSQHMAAEAVKKLPGVRVAEFEKVPEDEGVQQKMKKLIEIEKAKLIFAGSFGYFDPHVIALAKKYPNVQFMHRGNIWTADRHPQNIRSYFAYLDAGKPVPFRYRGGPYDQKQ